MATLEEAEIDRLMAENKRLREERDLALEKFAEVVEECEAAASYQGQAPLNPFKAIAQEIRKLKQT